MIRKENMARKAKSPSPATIRKENMAGKAKSPSPAMFRYGNEAGNWKKVLGGKERKE